MRYALALSFAATVLAVSPEWPQFRGPGSNGLAEDPALPDRWSATKNIAWKVTIPGLGWSSPVVAGNRIFVTSVISSQDKEPPQKGLYRGGERPKPADEHRWMVYAIDFKTGKTLWEREVYRGAPPIARHMKNTYASETPVTDGERVYAYFGTAGLFCLDMKGKVLWSWKQEAQEMRNGWGTAASPIVDASRVYVVDDNDRQSYIAALDKLTGREIWRQTRDEKSNWATPFLWNSGSRTEIVVPGSKKVRSYDLDGKVLWEIGPMSSIDIPTPFTRFNLLYLASGYVGDQNRPVFVIKPGAKGDISLKPGETSNEFVQWSLPQAGPYNPSPLVYGDIYYTLLDRGFLTAHDAHTGKELYGKIRIDPAAAAFTASPWAYNGKIFALSEDGDTFVIKAGATFELAGKNSLDEMCMATPAIARGSLIIRTSTKLYRIAKTK